MSTVQAEMKATAIVSYFGGKRGMAPIICEELGPHRAYWEPFCGSMAVLMRKQPSSHEHVNDLHEDLINLARVIVDPKQGPQLYRKLRRTLCHEGIFGDCQQRWVAGNYGADEARIAQKEIAGNLRIAKKLRAEGRIQSVSEEWSDGYERGLIEALQELEGIKPTKGTSS